MLDRGPVKLAMKFEDAVAAGRISDADAKCTPGALLKSIKTAGEISS